MHNFKVRDVIEVKSVMKRDGQDFAEFRTAIVEEIGDDWVNYIGHHVDDRLTTGSGRFIPSKLETTKYGLAVSVRVIGRGALPMDGFWRPSPDNRYYNPM